MRTQRDDLIRRLGAALLVALSASQPLPAQVTFDWATVGNPGNAPDTLVMAKGPAADFTTGYGSVGYTYQISKHSVTNAQYVQFLNAVDPTGANGNKLYDSRMTSWPAGGVMQTGGVNFNAAAAAGSKFSVKTGQDNYPATWINWTSGARFVNWLANGQGSGSTESGVYDMSAFIGNSFATPPTRASGATVFLPSEDEYYKAAYYDPAMGGTGGYWQYGTRSNTAPASVAPPGTSNSANIGAGVGNGGNQGGVFGATAASTQAAYDTSVNYLTDVGAYTNSKSSYGLYDLDGLVYNWTEGTRVSFGNNLPIYRGGAWYYNEAGVGAAYRNVYSGAGAASYSYFGFRVASLPSAPPSTITINVGSGTQTQTQAGYPSLSGTTPVFKTGAGTLVLDQANTLTGSATVQAGALQLANGSALSASRLVVVAGGTGQVAPYLATSVASLDLASGNGLMDLSSGALTIAGGMTATELVAEILEGRGDGSWTGTSGITSSVAAAQVASSIPRAVGWVDNGDGSLSVAYAAPGDTNIDWSIDILDASNFLAGGKFDSGSPAIWIEGDFSYDGVVDILDAADFFATGLYDAGNYNTAPGLTGGVAAVPEPATWSLLALAGAVLVRRPRREER